MMIQEEIAPRECNTRLIRNRRSEEKIDLLICAEARNRSGNGVVLE